MKKFITVIILLTILFSTFTMSVSAETATGIVVCTNVSVRKSMDIKAERYGRLKNGTTFTILSEYGEWYILDISEVGLGESNIYGYVLKQYVLENPYYIELTESTILWADPFGSDLAVGEKSAGSKLLVLFENDGWYVVQCKETTAGSAFIKKDTDTITYLPQQIGHN